MTTFTVDPATLQELSSTLSGIHSEMQNMHGVADRPTIKVIFPRFSNTKPWGMPCAQDIFIPAWPTSP